MVSSRLERTVDQVLSGHGSGRYAGLAYLQDQLLEFRGWCDSLCLVLDS